MSAYGWGLANKLETLIKLETLMKLEASIKFETLIKLETLINLKVFHLAFIFLSSNHSLNHLNLGESFRGPKTLTMKQNRHGHMSHIGYFFSLYSNLPYDALE